MKNYYEILEVDKNASKEVIDKAYRTLVKKYHPDLKNSDEKITSEEKIKQINEAYDVLSNELKRDEYNMTIQNNYISIDEYNKLINENNKLKNELNYIKNKFQKNDNYYYQKSTNYSQPNYTTNNYEYYNINQKDYNNTTKNNNYTMNLFNNILHSLKNLFILFFNYLIYVIVLFAVIIILKPPFIMEFLQSIGFRGIFMILIIIFLFFSLFIKNRLIKNIKLLNY